LIVGCMSDNISIQTGVPRQSGASVIHLMDILARSTFEQAVDGQGEAVASICHNEQTHLFDARFMKRGERSFCFQISNWPDSLPTGGAASGLKVSFEFATNGRGATFETDVQSIERIQAPDGTAIAVACCSEPADLNLSQRREHFRTPVPPGAPVSVVVWKIPPFWVLRDRPKPSQQLRVELMDISTGGICLNILPHRKEPQSVAKGDRLRIEMRFEDSEAILDGQVVHWSEVTPEQCQLVGVGFRKLDGTIEGRRGLFLIERAIAALQRLSIKVAASA
jgi:c-di-GMP-binding flagellar brake protein YcgR